MSSPANTPLTGGASSETSRWTGPELEAARICRELRTAWALTQASGTDWDLDTPRVSWSEPATVITGSLISWCSGAAQSPHLMPHPDQRLLSAQLITLLSAREDPQTEARAAEWLRGLFALDSCPRSEVPAGLDAQLRRFPTELSLALDWRRWLGEQIEADLQTRRRNELERIYDDDTSHMEPVQVRIWSNWAVDLDRGLPWRRWLTRSWQAAQGTRDWTPELSALWAACDTWLLLEAAGHTHDSARTLHERLSAGLRASLALTTNRAFNLACQTPGRGESQTPATPAQPAPPFGVEHGGLSETPGTAEYELDALSTGEALIYGLSELRRTGLSSIEPSLMRLQQLSDTGRWLQTLSGDTLRLHAELRAHGHTQLLGQALYVTDIEALRVHTAQWPALLRADLLPSAPL